MNLNPWDPKSDFRTVEGSVAKWTVLLGATAGGLWGVYRGSFGEFLVGVMGGMIGGGILSTFGWLLVVAPALFFVYGFVEMLGMAGRVVNRKRPSWRHGGSSPLGRASGTTGRRGRPTTRHKRTSKAKRRSAGRSGTKLTKTIRKAET